MSNRPGRKIARQQANAHHTRAEQHPSGFWSQPTNRLLVALGALVLVIGGVVALALSGGDDDGGSDGELFQMNGIALPEYVAGGTDPAVGTKAPVIVTEDLDGNRVVTGGGNGPQDTAKVIGFFAHWCPVCQAELPEVANRLATPLPAGVEVVAVSTLENASRDNHPPSAWFESVDWPSPVVADTARGDVANAFGMAGVPYWVVVDNANQVLARVGGAVDATQLEALIDLAASTVDAPADLE